MVRNVKAHGERERKDCRVLVLFGEQASSLVQNIPNRQEACSTNKTKTKNPTAINFTFRVCLLLFPNQNQTFVFVVVPFPIPYA